MNDLTRSLFDRIHVSEGLSAKSTMNGGGILEWPGMVRGGSGFSNTSLIFCVLVSRIAFAFAYVLNMVTSGSRDRLLGGKPTCRCGLSS